MSAITVTLPYPISANRYWRTRVFTPRKGPQIVQTYVSPEAKKFKTEVQWLLKAAGIRKPLVGRVALWYVLYPNRPQDYRTRMRKLGESWDDSVMCIDLDNAQKVLLDALKGLAFEDDIWVREIYARRAEPDEGGARLVVKIQSIAPVETQTGLELEKS